MIICRDIDSLLPHDVKGNCKKAFDAGEALGIPRVIEPADMDILTVPDKLAVMTYLYQLRAHFTGHELEVTDLYFLKLFYFFMLSLCYLQLLKKLDIIIYIKIYRMLERN